MDLPDQLLPLVMCAKCNSYLSRQPVMMLPDGRSVCGRCSCQTFARNFAYEALAQLAMFPCRYYADGCKKSLSWNTSAVHEATCEFNSESYENESQPTVEVHEHCSVCHMNIFVAPRYECIQGHKICSGCTGPGLYRCQLCKSKIPLEIYYPCKYWTFGCKRKDTQDIIKRHQIDCCMRGYNCPFAENCKWIGSLFLISKHLKSKHSEDTVVGEEATRIFQMRDDSWTMIAHDEIFRCYAWMVGNEIEWFAKYVGPQERCYSYSCEVRLLSNTTKSILRMKNNCHGWNNVALEKCIRVSLIDVSKYVTNKKITYKFGIIKKIV